MKQHGTGLTVYSCHDTVLPRVAALPVRHSRPVEPRCQAGAASYQEMFAWARERFWRRSRCRGAAQGGRIIGIARLRTRVASYVGHAVSDADSRRRKNQTQKNGWEMGKFKSRVGSVVFATAVVAGGMAVVATPANAAYTCGSNQVCLYKNSDFTGSVYVLPQITDSHGVKIFCAPDLAKSKYTDGSSANNSVSSIVNNSNSVIFLNDYAGSGGKHTGISGGNRLRSLTSVQTFDQSGKQTYESFDNRASSAC
ncbi:peptidase inhibitor family I36 protein [Streptomyces sp. NPDC058394]|uniref:peptidase inhibitor family I36 protein n=1 Tax=Streptomyces sp. NPDC058394 TaxID=3346477 RepID=UPI003669F088